MKKILPLKHSSLKYKTKEYISPSKKESSKGKIVIKTLFVITKSKGLDVIVNKINELVVAVNKLN
jgi:hypothetical protein